LGSNCAEHRERHARLLQQGCHEPQQAGLQDPLVGDQQQPARSNALQLGGQLADGAAAWTIRGETT